MTASRRARFLALAAACAALLAVVLVWVKAPEEPRAAVVAASSAPVTSSSSPVRAGWKTIEYQGVQLDIPSAWERLDMSDCEFQYEQWAPPKSKPCGYKGGAAFYGSATFDPFHAPGVWRTAATWSGYVYAGDFAVYASGPDRDLVQGVLSSAR